MTKRFFAIPADHVHVCASGKIACNLLFIIIFYSSSLFSRLSIAKTAFSVCDFALLFF